MATICHYSSFPSQKSCVSTVAPNVLVPRSAPRPSPATTDSHAFSATGPIVRPPSGLRKRGTSGPPALSLATGSATNAERQDTSPLSAGSHASSSPLSPDRKSQRLPDPEKQRRVGSGRYVGGTPSPAATKSVHGREIPLPRSVSPCFSATSGYEPDAEGGSRRDSDRRESGFSVQSGEEGQSSFSGVPRLTHSPGSNGPFRLHQPPSLRSSLRSSVIRSKVVAQAGANISAEVGLVSGTTDMKHVAC